MGLGPFLFFESLEQTKNMHGKCNSARQIGRSGLHIGVRLHHVPFIVIGTYLDKETGNEYKIP
jgi:hypothetical protein